MSYGTYLNINNVLDTFPNNFDAPFLLLIIKCFELAFLLPIVY